MCDERTRRAVRDEDGIGSAKDGILEPGDPVGTVWALPILLMDTPKGWVSQLPPGLPVLWTGVEETRKNQDRIISHVDSRSMGNPEAEAAREGRPPVRFRG